MSLHGANSMKSLPERFDPTKRAFELYEDVNYRGYWEEPHQRRIDASEKRLIQRLLRAPGRRILDLGCGHGRLAPCYLDRYDKIVLFDGAISLLRQARAALGERAIYVAGDARRIPFRQGAFDSVLLIRVIQHFRDVPACLREARRVLVRRGRLVFSYHNKRNLRRIIRRLVFRDRIDPFDRSTQEVSGALLSHHPQYVLDSLRACGFSSPAEWGVGVFEGSREGTACDTLRNALASASAKILGSWNLAPWTIGSAYAVGGGPSSSEGSLESALQCPRCRGGLRSADRESECLSCGSRYPTIDGIHDFRLG